MFDNSNGQIKLCAKQKYKFLSATHNITIASDLSQHYVNLAFDFHQYDTQIFWNVCFGASTMNAMLYSMPFPNFWRTELHYAAAFLTNNALLTLVCCTVDKTEKK